MLSCWPHWVGQLRAITFDSMSDRVSKPKSIGARGVERFARSGCTRERSLLLNNADPGWVATQVLGQPPTISAYAPRAGEIFEQQLYANDAAQLQQALASVGVLQEGDWVPIIKHPAPATDPDYDQDHWVQEGTRLVLRYMRDGGDPVLALQVALPLRFLGGRQLVIRPDGLLWTGERWKLIEIKSRIMATRRSEASAQLLVSARRQAAVGLLALAQLAAVNSVPDQVLDHEEVLLCRSSHRPWVLAFRVAAQGDLNSLRWMLEHADPELEQWATTITDNGLSSDTILRIPHQMGQACRHHCPLLSTCLQQAERDDNPAAIWLNAGDWLPPGTTTTQLIDIIDGGTAEAVSSQQAKWLRAGWSAVGANGEDNQSLPVEAV